MGSIQIKHIQKKQDIKNSRLIYVGYPWIYLQVNLKMIVVYEIKIYIYFRVIYKKLLKQSNGIIY